MTVQPKDNPFPPQPAKIIVPTITPPTPYASQRVTMTVTPDNPVDATATGQGKYLYFDFDSPKSHKQGIVTYPSLEDERWLDISTTEAGPWTCTGIVDPDGVDDITWAASINTTDVTPDVNPSLATDPAKPANMGKGKPIMAPMLIGSLTVFTPVTQTTRPTTGGSNQLLCTFQITDGQNNPITNPGAPFTATFTENDGLPLANYFDFYMGETADTAQLVTTVTSDGSTVAVDTLPSDLTTLRCWVVPKANQTSVITGITASIGGYELSFGMVAIVDLTSTNGVDQYKPPMRILEDEYHQVLQFSDDLPELHVAIDTKSKLYKPNITYQQGDCFLLVINNQVSKQSGLATFSVSDPGKVLFTIRPDEPLLIKGVGTKNNINFVYWRPQGDNDLPPNIYYGTHIPLALKPDDRGNPPRPGPVQSTPNYDAPCIGKLEGGTTLQDGVTLTSPVIATGIAAKIIWPVADPVTLQKAWTPNIGDSIAINLWIAGWDGDGKPRASTQTNSYGPLTQNDVGNPFILIPLFESWFSDWGNKGQTGPGTHSSIQMQYAITPLNGVTSYSAPYTVGLNTIDPGSGH